MGYVSLFIFFFIKYCFNVCVLFFLLILIVFLRKMLLIFRLFLVRGVDVDVKNKENDISIEVLRVVLCIY